MLSNSGGGGVVKNVFQHLLGRSLVLGDVIRWREKASHVQNREEQNVLVGKSLDKQAMTAIYVH